jgi:hypothetical protein
MQKPNSIGGRPKQVAEFIEGNEASANFVGAMRHIFSGRKSNTKHNGNGHGKHRKTVK